jgi:TolB-like protein
VASIGDSARSHEVAKPSPESVHVQLRRILDSADFSDNEQRKAFLRYVVEETLAGRADRLKGFSIAVSVLDRNEDFDPQSDPVVRLQARRLRRELEHYYLTAGRDDPVHITIPKGSYVPLFERVDHAARQDVGDNDPRLDSTATRYRARLAIIVASVVGLVAIVALALVGWLASGPSYSPNSDLASVSGNATAPATPTIAVLPLVNLGTLAAASDAAAGFTEDIVTDLSRVPGLRVIAHSSSSRFGGKGLDSSEIGEALGATHLLRGTYQSDGEFFRVNASLIDIASGHQLWVQRFDHSLDDMFSTQVEIAGQVTAALSVTLLPDASRGNRTGLKDLQTRALYRQALTLVNPPNDPSRFIASRELFHRIIELEPDSPHGYSGLAFILGVYMWFGHVEVEDARLDEIDRLASMALAIDPGNAQARIARSVAAMLRREYDTAVELCREAVAAEPSNSHAHGYLAVMLVFDGRADEAIQHAQSALRLDPVNTRVPFENILGVSQFGAGDYPAALGSFQRNVARGGPFGPHIMVMIAAIHAEMGETGKEQEILKDLRNNPSGFSVAGWLRRSFRDPKDIEKFLTVLAKVK